MVLFDKFDRGEFERAWKARARVNVMPDGSEVHTVSDAVLAEDYGDDGPGMAFSCGQALCAGVLPERYLRNYSTYGVEQQFRIHESIAAMVGLGGLGGNVFEILVRAGVGSIRAADGDGFEESNLNRQVLSSIPNLYTNKAEAADKFATAVNPCVEICCRDTFLDESEMERMLSGADVAVDCLGGLGDRMALVRAARKAGIDLVTAAVAGRAGYVGVIAPGGLSPVEVLGGDVGNSAEKTVGTPAPAMATAASIQAGAVLDILATGESRLAGKVLLFDLADWSFETITL